MQRFFRPEKLVHALKLLKGQIKSINDNLSLGKKGNGYVLNGISGDNCIPDYRNSPVLSSEMKSSASQLLRSLHFPYRL